MIASLHVIEGPDHGRLFAVNGSTVTIGRSADNTIVLNDVAVSGVHSKIVRTEAGTYAVHDAQSTNGTFVNGKEARVVDLRHGDTLRVGGTVMAFELRRQGGTLHSEGEDRGAVSVADMAPATAYRAPDALDVSGLDRAELEQRVLRAGVLEQLDRALARLDGSSEVLAAVLDAALAGSGAQRGFVLLLDERTGEIVPAVARDLLGRSEAIGFSKSLAFDVLADGKGALAEDTSATPPRPVVCAPIVAAGRTLGVLYLDAPRAPFAPAHLETVEAIGRRAGAAVAAARSRTDFEVLFSSMVDAIMKSIQAKDVYTRGHSERVRHYSRLLGKELGLSGHELYRLTLGAALHDIGKIGMPDSVLKFNTNPRLSPEQLEEVKKHPSRGAKILGEIPFLRDVVAAAELHHEDWDGGGYPHGLKGEEIPLIARIVAVADTYDAITTDRPYQKGQSYEGGHAILRKIAGKRLDPELVEAFIRGWYRYRKGPTVHAAPEDAPPPVHKPAAEDVDTLNISDPKAAAALRAAIADADTVAAGADLAASATSRVERPPADGAVEDDGPDDDVGENLKQIILIG